MQLFYQPQIVEGVDYLDSEESRHCIKVLRKQLHDLIDIVDGQGTYYQAVITKADPKRTHFEIKSHREEAPTNISVHLAVAPTKRMERMEWMVEKATELGVASITFLNCRNSQRRQLRLERLQRKSISAMKQSLKATLPKLRGMQPFDDFLNSIPDDGLKLLAHLSQQAQKISAHKGYSDIAIAIGPEGDFSAEEVQAAITKGFKTVHLGPHRLRTETAALKALISVQLGHE